MSSDAPEQQLYKEITSLSPGGFLAAEAAFQDTSYKQALRSGPSWPTQHPGGAALEAPQPSPTAQREAQPLRPPPLLGARQAACPGGEARGRVWAWGADLQVFT